MTTGYTSLLHQAKFYYKMHVAKSDVSYDGFYDFVVFETITTAMHDSNCVGSRFNKLLHWRFIDYIRRLSQKKTEEFYGSFLNEKYSPVNSLNHETSEGGEELSGRITLDRAIRSLDGFAELVLSGRFKDQTLNAKLAKISKVFEIDTFLGIPISNLPLLDEMCKKKRQNKEYHVNKFDKIVEENTSRELLKFHSEIYVKGPVCSFSEIAKKLRNHGERIKDEAKLLYCLLIGSQQNHKPRYENLSKSGILILSLIYYLKASFYFKEALVHDPHFVKARYNYAYCLKRLGKLEDAMNELEDCLSCSLEKEEEKARILECLGDTFLLKKEYDKALQLFQEALSYTPADFLLLLNCLEAAFHLNDRSKIIYLLNELVSHDEKLPFLNRNLILKITNTYPGEIAKVCTDILDEGTQSC